MTAVDSALEDAVRAAVDPARCVELTRDLVRCDRRNPPGDEGGSMPNVVASHCSFRFDRRFLPGRSRSEVAAEVGALLARAAPDVHPEINSLAFVEGSEIAADDPFARLTVTAAGGATGGLYLGTNPRFLRNALGIPTVVYGPGSMARAHTADEYVEIDQLTTAARTFAAVYAGFGRN